MHIQSTLVFAQHHTTYTLLQIIEVTNTQLHLSHTHIQSSRHDHIHRSKPLDPLSHVPHVLSHRGGPPAMFDWFFEAACPASLQEGELGVSGGNGDMRMDLGPWT